MICFGPISSRRLGRSLGINNILRPKRCTYNCVYCQVGRTAGQTIQRENFFNPDVIDAEVRGHLEKADRTGKPEYLTFVANGEPTLDALIGQTIRKIKSHGIPIAVITNASLLFHEAVRDEIMVADWVSVKTDAPDPVTWKRINRPHTELDFDTHTGGILRFASDFPGTLCTETMLIHGVNDDESVLNNLAQYIREIRPAKSYISAPVRPPAEPDTEKADRKALNRLWELLMAIHGKAEWLAEAEPARAGFTGNAEKDILNVTAVHPLREDELIALLNNDHADFSVMSAMIEKRQIKKVVYEGMNYYLRDDETL